MRTKRMAFNLTLQVRSIASVTKAVAAGDLSQTVNVEVEGEVLELKQTVNGMVEQVCLMSFCERLGTDVIGGPLVENVRKGGYPCRSRSRDAWYSRRAGS